MITSNIKNCSQGSHIAIKISDTSINFMHTVTKLNYVLSFYQYLTVATILIKL